ncbi:MAG: SAVMC3_10250 family protein [Pseudonocardiaceae bacterium]
MAAQGRLLFRLDAGDRHVASRDRRCAGAFWREALSALCAAAFFPERPPRRLPTTNLKVGLQPATLEVGPPAARGPTDAELHRLRQVRRQLKREAAHFYAPDLRTGDWIYFDFEMGWSTSHEDSGLPDLDNVLLFFGSMASERSRAGTAVDLMLCGSTEHLLKKTATAGRMGSGAEWLHKLILKISSSSVHMRAARAAPGRVSHRCR